eukprot:CAMPEP_0175868998 /NCGR_PEP_ID=MMETSP0107_2-20121207/35707_1 /TAXON_ID=195067 ORGANISM="Goniomonas pacifica, Strain CCMP1869" /NCGR_SAMPLE_ID=MMETSP0107_2 /ASSEMBLY_ACC=CAM_ASM_000203 /LENGTH=122 /DNA_ID=CAMNT_0017186961 /DNA_START=61 /DNA_END=430 /DNA_ORIENTATION=-
MPSSGRITRPCDTESGSGAAMRETLKWGAKNRGARPRREDLHARLKGYGTEFKVRETSGRGHSEGGPDEGRLFTSPNHTEQFEYPGVVGFGLVPLRMWDPPAHNEDSALPVRQPEWRDDEKP